jgi:hypothetical protein
MEKNQDCNLGADPTSTPDNNDGKPRSHSASGPKTARGKRRVRFNARTHGFYSRELVVIEEDRAEFDALKKGISTNLNPTTQLQLLGFERVVSAAWRHKLALRMEARRLKPQLEASDRPELGNASDSPRWYTGGPRELNGAAKVLSDLKAEVQANGGVHLAAQRDVIVKVFGGDFYNALTQWGAINTSAVLLSEQLQTHAEILKMPLPTNLVLPADVVSAAGRLRWDMMVKVVDLKLQEVSQFHRLLGQSVRESESPQTVALDVVNRYVTSTGRELERAIDWYGQLVEKGL